MSDVLQYGVESDPGNNKIRVIEQTGFKATVVYLPAATPYRHSIVTAFTNGSPTNQWTLCKNIL